MKFNAKKFWIGVITLTLGLLIFLLNFVIPCTKTIDIRTLLPSENEVSLINVTPETQEILCRFIDLKFTLITIASFTLFGIGLSTVTKSIIDAL